MLWLLLQEFISQKGYPGWTQVTMVREGAETPLFKQNFTDWLNKGEVTGLPKYEKKGERMWCVDEGDGCAAWCVLPYVCCAQLSGRRSKWREPPCTNRVLGRARRWWTMALGRLR